MKKLISVVCLTLVLCMMVSVAFAGSSIPAAANKKDGSYNGTFNGLGGTLNYSNYNVKPSASAMSFWVTGKMNTSGATGDVYAGAGKSGSSTNLASTNLYNFDSESNLSRNNSYGYSFSTSTYYWSSFKLSRRSVSTALLVGSFTFRTN